MAPEQRDIIAYLKSMPHKEGVNPSDWDVMHPSIVVIAWATAKILKIRGAPVKFTSLIREGIPGVSVSKSHIEGRAFDMSVSGLTVDDIDAVLEDVNMEHAQKRGAVSLRDKVARALIFEHRSTDKINPRLEKFTVVNQADPHLHGQCRR